MNKTIQINIQYPKGIFELEQSFQAVEKALHDRYYGIYESLISKNLWSESITNIVFCTDLDTYIDEFNEKWGTCFCSTKEKEFTGKAINLRNVNKEVTIALAYDILGIGARTMDILFLNQVFVEKAFELLPQQLMELKQRGLTTEQARNIDTMLEYAFTVWFPYHYTQFFLQEVCTDELKPQSHDKFMINFKRNVRNLLYDAQSDNVDDGVWFYVWKYYAHYFIILIRNLISDKTLDKKLHLQNENEAKICYEICDEIEKNYLRVLRTEEIDLQRIKELFIEFAASLSITIIPNYESESSGIYFKFRTNPKEIFKGIVVDTLPSFVTFIDILGFRQMIEKYQTDPQSTLLQDLKEAFDGAITETNKMVNQLDGSYLEYRLFSDNFSAAIPFFESKQDFFDELYIILLLIKNYQYQLMIKGFFVRGGFSHGDYYSDSNMIFSGALVDAYYLEAEVANYPRILFSKKTIQSIEDYLDKDETLPDNLQKSIIYCPKDDVFFVNPYLDLKKQLNSLLDMVNDVIPELEELIKLTMNINEEDISDEKVVAPIQKELEIQMKTLKRDNNLRAFEKLEWLYQFNEWYITQDSNKFSFYRSIHTPRLQD